MTAISGGNKVMERSFGLSEYDKLSLVEIAQSMHVTRERIRQIRGNAIRKLKRFVREKSRVISVFTQRSWKRI